jgi:4-alpha-glucanotransferase
LEKSERQQTSGSIGSQKWVALWQILPFGPTGYGDSPYQSFSSFAGNTLLIDLDRLIEEGLLSTQDLAPRPEFSPHHVNYSLVMDYKERLLALASERYLSGAADHLKDDFELFCEAQTAWLDDFALFMALKKSHQDVSWPAWEQPLVVRQQEAIERAAKQLGKEVEDQRFRQFIFFRQWEAVRQHAAEAGVTIIGDIPFFTAHDSADVWSNQNLFQLNETGEPIVVSGVPPDYFSSTGQRWGNPHYRWDILRAKDYRW